MLRSLADRTFQLSGGRRGGLRAAVAPGHPGGFREVLTGVGAESFTKLREGAGSSRLAERAFRAFLVVGR